jgi:hypothetical protein
VSPPASLVTSRQTLAFNYTIGGTVPPAQNISVTSSTGTVLPWTVSSSVAWLTVSPASGSTSGAISVLPEYHRANGRLIPWRRYGGDELPADQARPAGAGEDGYKSFIALEPVQFTGFKLFYKKDRPMMPPERVLGLTPKPVYIQYQ